MAKRLGKKPKIYNDETGDRVESLVDKLVQNPKGFQARDLVVRLRGKIEAAQEGGHKLEDVVAAFNEGGVSITLNTLKRYLQESRAADLEPPLSEGSVADTKEQPKKSTSSAKKGLAKAEQSQREQPAVEKQIAPKSQPQLTNTNEEGFQEMPANL